MFAPKGHTPLATSHRARRRPRTNSGEPDKLPKAKRHRAALSSDSSERNHLSRDKNVATDASPLENTCLASSDAGFHRNIAIRGPRDADLQNTSTYRAATTLVGHPVYSVIARKNWIADMQNHSPKPIFILFRSFLLCQSSSAHCNQVN